MVGPISPGKISPRELEAQASEALRAIAKPIAGISNLEDADLVAHVEAYKIQTRSERQKTSVADFLDPLVRQRLFLVADLATAKNTDDPKSLRISLAVMAKALHQFADQMAIAAAAGHLPGIGHAISVLPQLKIYAHSGEKSAHETLVPFRGAQALVIEEGERKFPIGIVISHQGLGATPDGKPISLLVEIADPDAIMEAASSDSSRLPAF